VKRDPFAGGFPPGPKLAVTPEEVRHLVAAVQTAIYNWVDVFGAYDDTPADPLPTPAEYDALLAKVTEAHGVTPLLIWARHDWGWEAVLGSPADGVTFTVVYLPTCYRRGRWVLQVRVHDGRHHEEWGCFDAADQPERYYHDPASLVAEAEAISAVLLADRLERGPTEGWVPRAQTAADA